MNTIQLKYKKKTITRNIPSRWDELTGKQLKYISALMEKKISTFNFCLFSLIVFLKIKPKWLKRIDGETLYILSEHTHFLLDETNGLTENLFPVIKVKYKKYYGPDSMLTNITLIEYAKAESRFIKYAETKDNKYLLELIAILWRPKRFFKKQKYDDKFISNAEKLKALPGNITFSIFLFFSGCRNFIITSFPHVFAQQDETESENFGWAGLINDLAGTKFGDIDKTAETYLYTILYYLEQCAVREIENRKKDKK